MTRTKGAIAMSYYKYKVEHKISDDNTTVKFFISQPEIVRETGLKRSFVYDLICHPENRKDHKNYIITKLSKALPVYDTKETVIIKNKIQYN